MCPDWACRRDVGRPPRVPWNCSVRDEGDRRWRHVTLCRFPARGSGALASRDEHMTRLERWITATVAGRGDPGERQLLHRYAVWHALRRLRRRAGGQHVTHGQAVTVQRHVRAVITLLDWLNPRRLGPGTT